MHEMESDDDPLLQREYVGCIQTLLHLETTSKIYEVVDKLPMSFFVLRYVPVWGRGLRAWDLPFFSVTTSECCSCKTVRVSSRTG